MGKIVNGIVQGAAAGGVVFGGYVLSEYIVGPIDKALTKDGTPRLGRFQRPLLFGAVSGLTGTALAFAAKFFKGNRALFFILGAAGPGLHAFGGLIRELIPAEKAQNQGGALYRIRQAANNLADYMQVGDYMQLEDEAIEAGVGDEDLVEAGVGDDEEQEEYLG